MPKAKRHIILEIKFSFFLVPIKMIVIVYCSAKNIVVKMRQLPNGATFYLMIHTNKGNKSSKKVNDGIIIVTKEYCHSIVLGK